MKLRRIILDRLSPTNKNKVIDFYDTILLRKRPQIRDMLKKNAALLNSHNGERCFILGNGPSLKKINLASLKNEIVFTVNNAHRIEGFFDLNPSFHVWSDPDYFNGVYDKEVTLRDFRNVICNTSADIFVPAYAYDFMEENGLNEKGNVHIFNNVRDLYDGYRVSVDITRNIHICRTVVQYAVIIAMYMGFKEIYLLGCDATSILNVFDAKLNTFTTDFHAYDDKSDEQRYYFQKNPTTSEYICYSQYLNYLGWRLLSEYASNAGIIFRNCTEKSLIDSVEHTKLERVLNSEESQLSLD